jgi:hypothetical protein
MPSPGGDMNKILTLVIFVCMCAAINAFASLKPTNYQSGTVVSVESHEASPSNYVGSNLSDAPMQSEVYSYDIGIRIGCTVYRTEYDSAIDYLPAVFAANHPIQVNLRKHVMNVNIPGYREVRMPIDGHHGVKDQACTAGN